MAKPPKAERRPVRTTLHGRTRVDDYAWLADREDPAVREYLEAENAYAEAMLAPTKALQEQLYEEMVARIKEDDESVPVREGPFLYYWRTQKGKDYAIHCRKPADGGEEEVYLDENVLAEGHEYFSCADFDIEEGHRYLAYTVDTTGDERYTVRIRDLQTGAELPDVLEDVGGSVLWATDRKTLFYTRLDDAHRPFQIWRHTMGETEDVLVCQDDDERFFLGAWMTRDRKYILLGADSRITSEVSAIPADRPDASPRVLAPRRQGVEYSVVHHGDRFFFLTNEDAVNFKVVVDGEDFIAHDEETMLVSLEAFARHMVMKRRRRGVPELVVIPLDLEAGEQHVIEQPEPVYGVWVGTNPTFDTDTLRFAYSSMVTPMSVYDYDMNTRDRVLRKQTEVFGYDPGQFVSERVWADASDGRQIPISLVRRRDVTGAGPVYLSGYGAYGAIDDPTFSSVRLSLVERGVTVAVAHVRGGAELGRQWYDDGKLFNKANTFTDFIACAEKLRVDGHADRLAIYGGSAGGLLVGAVLNARPDLFDAAVAEVPFVDVVNTMLDPSLPLTVIEWEEWGNPARAADFEYITSYAPYENVEPKDYPAMLVVAGWSDPRVQYWEPAKWVARLRATKTDDNPLLLVTHLTAGHGGPSGRYPALREWALVYAFVLDRIG